MYLSLEATFHDLFWEAEGDPAELPLLRSFLASHPGRCLDLGCGSGRLLLPLLKDGFDLEGLDCSPDMLALCRDYATAYGVIPTLHQQDILTLDLPGGYQSVIMPAFTFQILPDASRALDRIHDQLAPGGVFYLTVFIPHAELSGDPPENQWYVDHESGLPDQQLARIHTCHRIDPAQSLLVRHHRYEILNQDGTVSQSHESTQHLRWYLPGELGRLLGEHQFQVKTRLAEFDPDDDHPTADSDVFTPHRNTPVAVTLAPEACWLGPP